MSTQAAVGATDNRNGYALGAKYNFGVAEASAIYTPQRKRTEGDGFGIGHRPRPSAPGRWGRSSPV